MHRGNVSMVRNAAFIAMCAIGGGVVADITVTVGEGDRTLSAADVAGLGSSENLVKKGSGRLVISDGLFGSSWSGAVKVDEGYLRVSHVDALGPSGAQGAIVADGATLEIDGSALANSDLACGKIAFAGSGVDGEGAVRVVGANWTHKNVSWTLTGDATWGGASSKSEVFSSGGSQKIDLAGHTLTLRGNGTVNGIHFNSDMGDLFVNPGNVIIDAGLYFVTEGTRFIGGDSHALTFRSKCQWRIANNARSQMTWRLVIEEGVDVQWACSGWASKWPKAERGWSGPVEIAKDAMLSWQPGIDSGSNPEGKLACTISGPISGEGTMRCVDNYLVLDNPNNSIANINNYGGHLYATSVSAVMPSFTNGTFTSSYLGNAEDLGTFITVSSGGQDDAAAIMYYHAHYPQAFRAENSDGKPKITLTVDGEVLSNGFEIGDYALLEATRYMVGAPYPEVARLTVKDGGVLDAGGPIGANTGIILGRNTTNNTVASRGILRLEEGGVISNGVFSVDDKGFNSGDSVFSQGTFVIDGGLYRCEYADGAWPYGMVGDNIGGCVLMRGGRWLSNNWVCFGHLSTGYGTFEMTGGKFEHTIIGGVGIGSHGGKAHMYVGGNASAEFLRVDMPFIVWGDAARTANAGGALTVDGNASVSVSSLLNFGSGSNSVSIINLNGGVMTAPISLLNGSAITNSTQIQHNMGAFTIADNRTYLNFNGGTLRLQGNGSTMRGDRITRIIVFGGGANIDLSTPSGSEGGGTLFKAFKAPTGKGVGAIPVPDVAAWEFTGSPLVEIEGDGYGASAFAQFDENAGLITNIVVTSPGCDYTWAKAILRRGGRLQDTEIAITDCLVDNDMGGGVRYFGNGTLTIGSDKYQDTDYRGATTISTGATVNYWSAGWHYPANSPLAMDGGVCRFWSGGSSLTAVKLVGLSGFGTVHAASIETADLGFDASAFMAGKTLDLSLTGNLEIDAGATLKIANAELLAGKRQERFTVLTTTGTIKCNGAIKVDSNGELDDGWRVFVSRNGIRIGCSLGTVVVVR